MFTSRGVSNFLFPFFFFFFFLLNQSDGQGISKSYQPWCHLTSPAIESQWQHSKFLPASWACKFEKLPAQTKSYPLLACGRVLCTAPFTSYAWLCTLALLQIAFISHGNDFYLIPLRKCASWRRATKFWNFWECCPWYEIWEYACTSFL